MISTFIFLNMGLKESNNLIAYWASINYFLIFLWIPYLMGIVYLLYRFFKLLRFELGFKIGAFVYYIICSMAVAHNVVIIVGNS